jgi:cold shock CspA family protein
MQKLAPEQAASTMSNGKFIGRIRVVDVVRGFGFIAGPNDADIFFHVTQLNAMKSEIVRGAIVSGEYEVGTKGLRLTNVHTFATPKKFSPDTVQEIRLKVCWFNTVKEFGFADLLEGGVGPTILFHRTHFDEHGHSPIMVDDVFVATLLNYRGSGRYRVNKIIRVEGRLLNGSVVAFGSNEAADAVHSDQFHRSDRSSQRRGGRHG